jgi:hypothetical protein
VDNDELAYRMGHHHARECLRGGIHPDAIRWSVHVIEELGGKPLGPECWRGVEDALAGRPCAPR